jgi:hypothetical protein
VLLRTLVQSDCSLLCGACPLLTADNCSFSSAPYVSWRTRLRNILHEMCSSVKVNFMKPRFIIYLYFGAFWCGEAASASYTMLLSTFECFKLLTVSFPHRFAFFFSFFFGFHYFWRCVHYPWMILL